jgi:hypothetical protein
MGSQTHKTSQTYPTSHRLNQPLTDTTNFSTHWHWLWSPLTPFDPTWPRLTILGLLILFNLRNQTNVTNGQTDERTNEVTPSVSLIPCSLELHILAILLSGKSSLTQSNKQLLKLLGMFWWATMAANLIWASNKTFLLFSSYWVIFLVFLNATRRYSQTTLGDSRQVWVLSRLPQLSPDMSNQFCRKCNSAQ